MSEEWNEVSLSPTAPEKEKIEFEVEGQEENESVDVASEPVQVEAEAEAKPSTEPAQDAEEGFEPAEAQTEDRHPVPRRKQVARHGAAHVSKTDKGNLCHSKAS